MNDDRVPEHRVRLQFDTGAHDVEVLIGEDQKNGACLDDARDVCQCLQSLIGRVIDAEIQGAQRGEENTNLLDVPSPEHPRVIRRVHFNQISDDPHHEKYDHGEQRWHAHDVELCARAHRQSDQ